MLLRKPSLTVTGAPPPAFESVAESEDEDEDEAQPASNRAALIMRGGRDTSHLVPNFYRLYRK